MDKLGEVIQIYVDGGSKGNGDPSSFAYGSMLVTHKGKKVRPTIKSGGRWFFTKKVGDFEEIVDDKGQVRWTFAMGDTNNQAELKSACLALTYIHDLISRSKVPLVFMLYLDSQLVARAVEKAPGRQAPHLRDLYHLLASLRRQITDKGCELIITKIEDTEVKCVLGH